MAITTVDQALAGMRPAREYYKALTGTLVAGRPHSLFYLSGIPGPAVAPSPGIGGAVLTSYAGQIPYINPSGGQNTYLTRFLGQSTQIGTLLLCDRLWHNSGINITSTSAQALTGSAQIPPRDDNGTNSGYGVYAGVEVSTVTGAGTPTLTLTYTNQSGATGKTTTTIISTVASSIAGTFYPLGLAAGDTGIQKATSFQLSATWTSGTIHIVLYRVLARLELPVIQTPNAIDSLSCGFTRFYDNTVPFLIFIPSTTTSTQINGQLVWTFG